jgi:hypothetical protein
MALALLWTTEDDDHATIRLRFDIGHNRYYGWALGDDETVVQGGIRRLAAPVHRSALLGPLDESAHGRGVLAVPRSLIGRDERFVQLVSFRDGERRGPAVSEIVALPPPGAGAGGLPVLAFSYAPAPGAAAVTPAGYPYRRTLAPVGNAPFRYRVRPMSESMDFGLSAIGSALMSALPKILPILAPAVGSLVGGAGPGLGQLVGNLLRGILPPGLLGSEAVRHQAVTQALGSLGRRMRARDFRNGHLGRRIARRSANAFASRPPRSEAMFLPALGALAPLLPLLQQVLTPQTVQALIDAPQKATGQIVNGVLDMTKLGLQAHEQEREHLRALNPGVNDPALNQLLMSMGMAVDRGRVNYRRVPTVRLDFEQAASQMLFGRNRVLYRKGQPLRFPLALTTPKPIPEARLLLQVKDADSLRVLAEDGDDVGNLVSGPLPAVPELSVERQDALEAGRDYILVATLTWKSRKGGSVGTSMQQRVTLVGEYAFDRVEETGTPIALGDFDAYRDYWHKIWEGEFGAETNRVELRSCYYLVLAPEADQNARLDSKLRAQHEGGVLRGKVKAGLELSPYALNRLLTRLAPDSVPLSEGELAAFAGADFAERLNQGAEHLCRLRGRRGERGAIWVYPEFKLQTAVLVHAAEVDENGNVKRLAEKRVRFPVPVLVHFVGVKST